MREEGEKGRDVGEEETRSGRWLMRCMRWMERQGWGDGGDSGGEGEEDV